MTKGQLLGVGALIGGAIIALSAFGDVVTGVSLRFAERLPVHPYFVPSEAPVLYLLLPLLLVASLVVLVAPGVLLVMAFRPTRYVPALMLKGTLISFCVHVTSFGAIKLISERPGPGAHTALIFAANIVALAILIVRAWAHPPARGTDADVEARRRWALLVAIPVLTALLLLPVLFWQDLNPDGLEALSAGRALQEHILPRFPDGEVPGLNLGMITSAYPIHWFIVLFGYTEAAGRLPLLLYAPLLFAGLLGLSEVRSARQLKAGEELAMLAGLAVFVAALAFNDTYHAYSTDIASPANIDFLAIAGMLATAYFFFSGEWPWFFGWALFTHMTRPTGLIFLGLLGLGVLVADRENWRTRVTMLALAIGLSLAWTAGFEGLLPKLTGMEIDSSAAEVPGRFRYLRFDDVSRFLWVIVPAGILPAFALPAWRRQDPVARVLLVVTVCYFAFFYVLAFTALHHFAVSMILPIVIFWRIALNGSPVRYRVAATTAAALVALWLSLPSSFAVNRTMRPIGRATVYRVGDYNGDYDEYRLAYDHKGLLLELFAPFWEVEDPATEFIGSPWIQIHYSSGGPIEPHTNYLVQPLAEPVPEGFSRLSDDGYAAVYVRDRESWQRDRYSDRNASFLSPVLGVPRETLFWMLGVEAGRYQIDVRRTLAAVLGR